MLSKTEVAAIKYLITLAEEEAVRNSEYTSYSQAKQLLLELVEKDTETKGKELEELYYYYEAQVDYVKRMIKNSHNEKAYSYWKAYLCGVYSIIDKFIQKLPNTELPELKPISSNTKTRKKDKLILANIITVFGKDYNIYLDDYGQCLVVEIDGKQFGLGTYNFDVSADIVFLVFQHLHDTVLEELDTLA